MKLCWPSFVLGAAFLLHSASSRAAEPVLLAADRPNRLGELQIAKVMAPNSTSWLSVRVNGPVRFAVVLSAASRERADSADAWLQALDRVTRVRVAPPLGPLAECAASELGLADSGLPEPPRLAAKQLIVADNELALRRVLGDAGLNVDLSQVVAFAAHASPPFRVSLYEAVAAADTVAERTFEDNSSGSLPSFFVADRSSLPATVIALGTLPVLPASLPTADPSEFPIRYQAVSAHTDYPEARAAWFAGTPPAWLVEARGSPVFDDPFSGFGTPVGSALALYVERAVPTPDRASCLERVLASRASAQLASEAYTCGTADDLARAVSELATAEPRLTRLFGLVSSAPSAFLQAALPVQSARVVATDFDGAQCVKAGAVPGSSGTGGSTVGAPGVVRTVPVDSGYTTPVVAITEEAEVSTTSSRSSCEVFSVGSGSDSCSGSTTSDSSSDSCSGSSTSDSSSDSCSGSSTPTDSSDSSGGCSKSNYDGDTCSGDTSSADKASKASAALESSSGAATCRVDRGTKRRPRPVRLSLLSLIGAALALPLRRRRSARPGLTA